MKGFLAFCSVVEGIVKKAQNINYSNHCTYHLDYRGGNDMPIVQIDLLEGRTLEQKRAMVAKVTDAIVETAQCPAEAVTIIIREMPPTLLGKGGKLRSDM